jgi:putative ABC transport system permease protein
VLQTYTRFYQFPMLRFRWDPAVIFSGVGVSLLFAALGALSAVRNAAKLRPAEGMRPEAPGVFRRTAIEGWRGLWAHLGFLWRMVFRNVARAKRRSFFTIGGVALAASIILLAFFTIDTMDELLYHSNYRVNLQDATVTFNSKRGWSAIHELRRLPGVLRAEPELVVPVRLRNGHRERRVGLFGLAGDGQLRGLIDDELRTLPKPTHGVLLTGKLGEVLGVRPGDPLEVRVLEGRRQVLTLPVEGTVDEYLGTNAYADLHALSRWIGEERALNSARLLVDSRREEELSRTLKDLPAVESVTFKEQEVRMFKETLVSSMAIMSTVFEIFAGIIAFGVIYNASRIALAERERTLASMRVLGFRRKEVAAVLTRENLLLTAASIPLGVGLGILFCVALAVGYDTELFRFPLVITPRTVLLTAASVLVFTVIANFAVARRIKKLDLVEALKSRE